MAVVYIKDMEFECKACNRRFMSWKSHEGSKKHRENVLNGKFDEDTVRVVIVDEKKVKRCWKCRCWRNFDFYRGENDTCVLYVLIVGKNGQRITQRK